MNFDPSDHLVAINGTKSLSWKQSIVDFDSQFDYY